MSFFESAILIFFSKRYHLFLQYGWFLQNNGKDFIRTNMHTTVLTNLFLNVPKFGLGKSMILKKKNADYKEDHSDSVFFHYFFTLNLGQCIDDFIT